MIRKKKIMVFIVIFVLIGITAILSVGAINKKRESKKIYQVSTEAIQVTDSVDTSIYLSGNVRLNANKKYNISLTYNAVIEDIYVEEGQKVEENQDLLLVKRYSDDNEFVIKSNKSGYISFAQELGIGSSVLQYLSIIKIYEISCIDDFYIEVPVLDSDFENINLESTATVTFGNHLANLCLNGKIMNDIPQINVMNGTTYYMVKIKLQDEDSIIHNYPIAVNMPVNIKLNSNIEIDQDQTDINQQYYIIPSYAVFVRNNQNAIFLYTTTDEKPFAELVYVDVLYNYNDYTSAIKCNSNTISSNSLIITSSDSDLYGGEPVTTIQNYQENLDVNLN